MYSTMATLISGKCEYKLEGPEGGNGAFSCDTTTSDGDTLLRNLAITKEFELKISEIMSII